MKNFAEKTIRAAGEVLRKKFRHVKTISFKTSAVDIVTEADFMAEKKIIVAIKKKFPTHHILSEESPSDISLKCDHLWITDPLDGTRNFAHGIPFFCVTLSYKEKGQTVLAMVYDPWHDELFWARAGKGAYLNNKRIRVKQTSVVQGAMVSFDFTRVSKKTVKQAIAASTKLLNQHCWVAGYKCAALGLAYLACGRVDMAVLYDLAPWDIDAGVLIAKEAGASVEVVEAKSPEPFYRYRVFTANPALFKKVVNKYVKLNF